ncbi:MAG: hypothetical protein CMI23_10790 [Opitutae bacterium]|nr:hypothetical protein [Opitutae bacterium]
MNVEFIEQLANTYEFSQICEKAEKGNVKAALFINKFVSELNILCFHLLNESHDKKIRFQINSLNEIMSAYPSLPKFSYPRFDY